MIQKISTEIDQLLQIDGRVYQIEGRDREEHKRVDAPDGVRRRIVISLVEIPDPREAKNEAGEVVAITQNRADEIESLAKKLFVSYCRGVGALAFDPEQEWQRISSGEDTVSREAWIEAAKAAL
jgi:hypothetical protein